MRNNINQNNAEGSIDEIFLEEGISVMTCQNELSGKVVVCEKISAETIQFHFCTKGKAQFNFNKGAYARKLEEDEGLILYNPQKALPLDFEVFPNSRMLSLLISIKRLHQFFSGEASYIDFLQDGKLDKKYYRESDVTPAMAVVLNQMLNVNLHTSVQKLYMKGKILELISLYFNRQKEVDVEQCPFLEDEQNVRKLRNAKEIILRNMGNPPTLKELSEEIGLSLKKLKKGFKEVYGDTVFGYLFDYKMEYARKLLESGQYNVNEVGLKIGYSAASHFIAAFKKKYGTTPKKYTGRMNRA